MSVMKIILLNDTEDEFESFAEQEVILEYVTGKL